VAGANEFSMSQQMCIFDHFSKLRIYNCIIVSQEHYVIGKEYSRPINDNYVDTGMKLVVYTWFPYQSRDICTEVNDITLLDSWVISAQGHFNKNNDLFPGNISKNLKGCPMKAVVRDGNWYFTAFYDQKDFCNGCAEHYISGLGWDLFKLFVTSTSISYSSNTLPPLGLV
jgi:hypothetical protein